MPYTTPWSVPKPQWCCQPDGSEGVLAVPKTGNWFDS